MSKNKIVLLVNNENKNGFLKEHGFSLLIQSLELNVLFDTGQGKTLKENASLKSIDWSQLQSLVLSHGHYDHTGGIPYVIEKYPAVRIYAHPSLCTERFHFTKTEIKNISIPEKAKQLLLSHSNLVWTKNSRMLSPHIGITGSIPREGKGFCQKDQLSLSNTFFKEDVVEDEIALWIKSKDGLIIITGCCHSGIKNTISHIIRLTSSKKIHMLIGGFHLKNLDEIEIHKVCSYLNELHIDFIVPCHCTGTEAIAIMTNSITTKIETGLCGNEWSFDLQN